MNSAVLGRAQQVADAFAASTGVAVDAAEILTGRAALLGLAPRSRISAGGATRLLKTGDGWVALTLSRPDDVAAVPALVGADTVNSDPWPAVEQWAARRDAAQFAERARLLGLPAAVLGETAAAPPRIARVGDRSTARPLTGLLVADLSSMWAGPLCGQLLMRAGATVVKVENPGRPDGTRAGSTAFFDWMNHGKLSYAATFDDIGPLLKTADVVIEASRPTALTRRGLGPESASARDGRVWLRITGHGAAGERADWVAFGDDAAVSGGLVEYRAGAPAFTGDAIADPLTGLHAAHAVVESCARGGGELIEFAMAAVAAEYAPLAGDGDAVGVVAPPLSPSGPALGADDAEVRRLIAEREAQAC
ncbi:CoA transferase [Mycolicibacterium wolinskyi]|uniref:Acyl-CoA transferase n=1 Tax=Mycolicibacterium wolinskyi TaxID=59750 RepID=A0A1X2ESU4_9MYCO|nr:MULTISPECIES: CoA transferase [Mycolicibacterium]MCV7287436.1 CoA transferase [Mycolicibacterium wolinskyi]MCV7294925.1 CoA transferase [Mycolicibacterium goodii]ORX09245.1 acyl-CoA transferase [Mycolicibacterium wolinskyi]